MKLNEIRCLLALIGVLFIVIGCVPSPDDPPATPAPSSTDVTAPAIKIVGDEGVVAYDKDVPLDLAMIKVNFSEVVSSFSSFTLVDSNGSNVPGINSDAGEKFLTFSPSGRLDYGTVYTVTLENVKDAAGNAMATKSFTFTTTILSIDIDSVRSLAANGDAGKYNQLVIDPTDQQVYIAYVVDGTNLKLMRPVAGVPESNADIVNIYTGGSNVGPMAMTISDNATGAVLDLVYLEQGAGLRHTRLLAQDRDDNSTWQNKLIAGFSTALPPRATISLVSDNATNLYLSFLGSDNATLSYASYNATTTNWSDVTAVNGPDAVGDMAGKYSSIVLDDSYVPHIAYYYYTSIDGNGNLKYAIYDENLRKWSNTSLLSTGEKGQLPVLNQLSGDNATIASDDIFDIVYYNSAVGGGDVKQLNSVKGFSESKEVGIDTLFADISSVLALKSGLDGTLYLAYYDNSVIKLATLSSNIWFVQQVDDVENTDGYFVSLGVDDMGVVHIAYYDPTDHDLKYARTKAP